MAGQSKSEQGIVMLAKAGQLEARQSIAGHGKSEQGEANQGSAAQRRAAEDKAKQDRPRHSSVKPDWAGKRVAMQAKAWQRKARQG